MRHQVDLGWRSASPIFSEPLDDLSPVFLVVLIHAAGGGFWGSHGQRVRLFLLQFRIFYRWCPLCALFCASTTLPPDGGHTALLGFLGKLGMYYYSLGHGKFQYFSNLALLDRQAQNAVSENDLLTYISHLENVLLPVSGHGA